LRIRVPLRQSRPDSKTGNRVSPGDVAAFHQALARRKYRSLFSSTPCPKKPGPKRPDEAFAREIVELKSRNPRFGCPRIPHLAHTFGVHVDKNLVYRVLAGSPTAAALSSFPSPRDDEFETDKFVRTSMLRLQQQQMLLRSKLDRVYEDRLSDAIPDELWQRSPPNCRKNCCGAELKWNVTTRQARLTRPQGSRL